MFKIKCDLPELRPLDAQDTVKIVTVILSVVDYKESAPSGAEMFHSRR